MRPAGLLRGKTIISSHPQIGVAARYAETTAMVEWVSAGPVEGSSHPVSHRRDACPALPVAVQLVVVMLEKTSTGESARASTRSKRAAPKAQIVNEPKPDWSHPWEAPFYCFSGNYIHSVEGWTGALQAKVQKIIERADALPSRSDPKLIGKWWFGCATNLSRAWITAMGIQTIIEPSFLAVMPWAGDPADLSKPDLKGWLINGYGKEILEDRVWEDLFGVFKIGPDQKSAVQWHKWLLHHLFWSWESDFDAAVKLGAAHIMARKQSVYAPFERITSNQWQYFQLDEYPSQPQPRTSRWGDPRGPLCKHEADVPWTATGPAGEKLYEIYIAPGTRSAQHGQLTLEEEVVQWLVKIAVGSPGPSTKTTARACKANLFSTSRVVRKSLSSMPFSRSTTNRESKVERTRRWKSPQKSPHEE